METPRISKPGLEKDLESLYVVPEGGAVAKLEAAVNNYGWAESGYPKITFTLNGNPQPTVSIKGF